MPGAGAAGGAPSTGSTMPRWRGWVRPTIRLRERALVAGVSLGEGDALPMTCASGSGRPA